ncbi:uncharacterized protein MONOS_8140 [Monocercomonoides exilis]|uniref:uncharacterized protein n=1 Tax=Monocercomonoides exilis TaxID=2049356 RepID=UPI00355A7B16|nr:hypothetical protein MONOS_8140 [Monocercomonoides exilis]|eukprot:MONOS_8140.1-p1 / transcript=MONOS_8140.1 / gene=MONOS_8140 / organism=Monocercomonoides_exilis_PA203 / gene_product=unspecified product / transcript_product=unspecified product / location=Mono_scaffold00298:29255-30640(-) / protein_length=462 / sequence_SO=supercontig / SO=protein_coding / is_pseudo=false
MFLSSPSAVPVKAAYGRTKSDVINSRPSVSSSVSSSSQSSHPSQHPYTQQSTYQPSSLKSSLHFDEPQSHSTSFFLRFISNSSSSSSSKRRSMLFERTLVLQSSRQLVASLYVRLPSDEVEVLRGVTSLLWFMQAALSSLSLLGEDNSSNNSNSNSSDGRSRSDRSDRITDYPLFADEDGSTARLDCLLPSSTFSKHLAMLTKASTERLFVSLGKAEGQTHSHSQSQTLMKTQTHTQNTTQSTIFSLKKRAESFTSSMFLREVSSCRIQLLYETVLPFDPFLLRVIALVDGKHVPYTTQIICNSLVLWKIQLSSSDANLLSSSSSLASSLNTDSFGLLKRILKTQRITKHSVKHSETDIEDSQLSYSNQKCRGRSNSVPMFNKTQSTANIFSSSSSSESSSPIHISHPNRICSFFTTAPRSSSCAYVFFPHRASFLLNPNGFTSTSVLTELSSHAKTRVAH